MIEQEVENNSTNSRKVHQILAHSYLIYFAVFVFGIIMDFLFVDNITLFKNQSYLGIAFICLGSYLLYWAQKTSRFTHKSRNSDERKVEDFMKGPYKHTRTPSQWGLLFMIVGFGLIIESVFVIVFSLITFVVMRFTFIRNEEKRLHQKYGDLYLEYKRKVRH